MTDTAVASLPGFDGGRGAGAGGDAIAGTGGDAIAGTAGGSTVGVRRFPDDEDPPVRPRSGGGGSAFEPRPRSGGGRSDSAFEPRPRDSFPPNAGTGTDWAALAPPEEHVEYAELSNDVYYDESKLAADDRYRRVPEGKLESMDGVSPGDFRDEESGFFSALYYDTEEGDYVLAFRGTEFQEQFWRDMGTNASQAMGFGDEQYRQAMELAEDVEGAVGSVEFTGHSLGGGLATAAAAATGEEAVTFNPSGLNWLTTFDQPHTDDLDGLVESYVLGDEALSTLDPFLPVPVAGEVGDRTVIPDEAIDSESAWYDPFGMGHEHRLPPLIEAMKTVREKAAGSGG